ncbi:hypothetical protein DL770_004893 [Monosporascus sp. CRB-9-2]|nr:hypothetical protein DL770_004893 [Monosporascus sp. CRB-9-2]
MALHHQHCGFATHRRVRVLLPARLPEITKAWYFAPAEVEPAKRLMELEGRASRVPYTRAKFRRIFSSWYAPDRLEVDQLPAAPSSPKGYPSMIAPSVVLIDVVNNFEQQEPTAPRQRNPHPHLSPYKATTTPAASATTSASASAPRARQPRRGTILALLLLLGRAVGPPDAVVVVGGRDADEARGGPPVRATAAAVGVHVAPGEEDGVRLPQLVVPRLLGALEPLG